MAKKTTKKQNKEIKEKPTQKIKEKTSNKVESMEKNPQIKDLEIEEKPPQKIKIEIPKKEVENIEVIPEEPQAEIKEDELVKVLKIPMQEATKEETTNPVKESLFSSDKSPEPEFEEEEEETENLNDKYFDEDSTDDDLDSTFFEDEELMAEIEELKKYAMYSNKTDCKHCGLVTSEDDLYLSLDCCEFTCEECFNNGKSKSRKEENELFVKTLYKYSGEMEKIKAIAPEIEDIVDVVKYIENLLNLKL